VGTFIQVFGRRDDDEGGDASAEVLRPA